MVNVFILFLKNLYNRQDQPESKINVHVTDAGDDVDLAKRMSVDSASSKVIVDSKEKLLENLQVRFIKKISHSSIHSKNSSSDVSFHIGVSAENGEILLVNDGDNLILRCYSVNLTNHIHG